MLAISPCSRRKKSNMSGRTMLSRYRGSGGTSVAKSRKRTNENDDDL